MGGPCFVLVVTLEGDVDGRTAETSNTATSSWINDSESASRTRQIITWGIANLVAAKLDSTRVVAHVLIWKVLQVNDVCVTNALIFKAERARYSMTQSLQ